MFMFTRKFHSIFLLNWQFNKNFLWSWFYAHSFTQATRPKSKEQNKHCTDLYWFCLEPFTLVTEPRTHKHGGIPHVRTGMFNITCGLTPGSLGSTAGANPPTAGRTREGYWLTAVCHYYQCYSDKWLQENCVPKWEQNCLHREAHIKNYWHTSSLEHLFSGYEMLSVVDVEVTYWLNSSLEDFSSKN